MFSFLRIFKEEKGKVGEEKQREEMGPERP